MKAPDTFYIVTGVAPGRSAYAGKTLNLGKFPSMEQAEKCKQFFSLHYDDIEIFAGPSER